MSSAVTPGSQNQAEFCILNLSAENMQQQYSPQATRTGGGETPSPRPRIEARSYHHFQSTVSVQKLRRFNSLIFVLRFGAFCFSMAASVFMLVNPTEPNSPRWYHFDAFRFVLAGNTVVAVYSLFQMGASFWEMSRGVTLLPEFLQVWFDFGHDQVFAYLLLSVETVGTSLARTLKITDTCMPNDAFCIQADISIVLGFIAFLFLVLSSLLSGFRVVCFIINGSRVHL